MAKIRSTILGWCLVVIMMVMMAILIYPSVFQFTRSQAYEESSQVIGRYQAAITRCIQRNENQLERCNAGQEGIPDSYTSWFHRIKSIHVYQGVIQVRIHLNLGEPVFVYYIPHQIRLFGFSSITHSNIAINWQHIETRDCALDKKNDSCKNFSRH
jgi:hypothetical protein